LYGGSDRVFGNDVKLDKKVTAEFYLRRAGPRCYSIHSRVKNVNKNKKNGAVEFLQISA
jgi:hypothetical protein